MVFGQVTLAVEHNFETAHRLPFLGGKCENLHGHSWKVKVYIQAANKPGGMDENGISIEYGSVKSIIRQWIDTYLDHGTMLGVDDPTVQYEVEHHFGKVFYFGKNPYSGVLDPESVYENRPWPTVEAVAEMLVVKLQAELEDLWIIGVEVRETEVNFASYTQAVPLNENVEVTNG